MLADIVVHGLGIGNSGEHMVPAFDIQAWALLNLPPGTIRSVVEQAVGKSTACAE